mmetsp:Transcript_19998/g.39291  ORF Transcript_19998/g.39291 Transcript_19998/m.39291 type:complete len:369 (+) Transcript_19998:200-1306(+)
MSGATGASLSRGVAPPPPPPRPAPERSYSSNPFKDYVNDAFNKRKKKVKDRVDAKYESIRSNVRDQLHRVETRYPSIRTVREHVEARNAALKNENELQNMNKSSNMKVERDCNFKSSEGSTRDTFNHQTVTIVVPEDAEPGEDLTLTFRGQSYRWIVPADVHSGQRCSIQVASLEPIATISRSSSGPTLSEKEATNATSSQDSSHNVAGEFATAGVEGASLSSSAIQNGAATVQSLGESRPIPVDYLQQDEANAGADDQIATIVSNEDLLESNEDVDVPVATIVELPPGSMYCVLIEDHKVDENASEMRRFNILSLRHGTLVRLVGGDLVDGLGGAFKEYIRVQVPSQGDREGLISRLSVAVSNSGPW